MSNYKNSIVCVEADQDAPDELFEKILETMTSVAGFAAAEDDVLKLDAGSEGASLDDIKGLCEDYKSSTRLFFFGEFPTEFHEDSCQPIVISENGEGDARVVAFLDGNFDEKAIDGSKNSPERDIADKYLAPALKRIYRGVGGDVAEFMQELKTDPSIPDLVNTWYKGRATITIFAANGEYASFGENALKQDFDWGWSSNPCGYGAAKGAIASAAEAVRKGIGGLRKGKGASERVTPPAAAAIPANVAARGGSEAEKYHAPPAKWSKTQKSEWYVEHNEGIVPPGYKDSPLILKMEFRPIKSLKDPKLAAVKRPVADVVPARRSDNKAVTTEAIPAIPPAQLKKMPDFIAANVTKNVNEGRNILDPKRIAELSEEHTKFSEAVGLAGLEDTFSWTYTQWLKLSKDVGIETALNALVEYQLAYLGKLAEEGTERPESQEPEEQEEPTERKSRFGGARSTR